MAPCAKIDYSIDPEVHRRLGNRQDGLAIDGEKPLAARLRLLNPRQPLVETAPLCTAAAAAYHPRMDLNPAQYDAVHTLAGPLLVLAGREPARPGWSPTASPS